MGNMLSRMIHPSSSSVNVVNDADGEGEEGAVVMVVQNLLADVEVGADNQSGGGGVGGSHGQQQDQDPVSEMSPTIRALSNAVVLRHILQYVVDVTTFRLVHSTWNDAVLSYPNPLLQLTVNHMAWPLCLPDLLNVTRNCDERLGRAIALRDEKDQHGQTTLSLINLKFDTVVQELDVAFHKCSNSKSFLLFARLLQQNSFPNLKSLALTFSGAFPYISHHECSDSDSDDNSLEYENHLEYDCWCCQDHEDRPHLTTLKVSGSFGKYTDALPNTTGLTSFVQRVLNAAPNLLSLSLAANISPTLERNLKLKNVEYEISFSPCNVPLPHPNSAKHNMSSQCYPRFFNNLEVIPSLETLRFKCLNMDSSCIACKSMFKNISYAPIKGLKKLVLYNPICIFNLDGNGQEILVQCLRQLKTIRFLGSSVVNFGTFKAVLQQGMTLFRQFNTQSNAITDGLGHSPEQQSLTLLTLDCSTFMNIFENPAPLFLKKLLIYFLEFDHSDVVPNRLTRVLDNCADLQLEHLSLGLRGPFRLSWLIDAFEMSKLFSSRSLQVVNIRYSGEHAVDLMVNDVDEEWEYRGQTQVFERVLGRVKHMREVTFTNFTMPAAMTAVLVNKINKENLPVRFLAEHKIFLKRLEEFSC